MIIYFNIKYANFPLKIELKFLLILFCRVNKRRLENVIIWRQFANISIFLIIHNYP